MTPTLHQFRWHTSVHPLIPLECRFSTSRVRTGTPSQGLSIRPAHPPDQSSEMVFPALGVVVNAPLEPIYLEVMMVLRFFKLCSLRVCFDWSSDWELAMKLLRNIAYFYCLCLQDQFLSHPVSHADLVQVSAANSLSRNQLDPFPLLDITLVTHSHMFIAWCCPRYDPNPFPI